MTTAQANRELTQVGRGTPIFEKMKRGEDPFS